jgi:hypothetical protein
MVKTKLGSKSWKALAILLLSAMIGACSPGAGPGGGSEEASGQTATLLVGGPGGGSSGRDVDRSVSDRVTLRDNVNCRADFREWDEALAQGEFQAVVEETESEIDAGDPALRTQALLYNSLGRLYTSADPLEVLESLDAARQNERELIICGNKGPALLAEGSMFAHAALGDFQAAEQELAAVAAIAPTAGDDLRGELEELTTVDTTTTAPAPSPTPSPSPTPVTPSPTESV